jgi:hypothetical protein
LAPKFCGKLGTYVPNYCSTTDGSMFGISIAPNADGSVIAVGSPINGPEATAAGGASVLTSWSDRTCEYAVVPVWQPEGCYKYFGAQVSRWVWTPYHALAAGSMQPPYHTSTVLCLPQARPVFWQVVTFEAMLNSYSYPCMCCRAPVSLNLKQRWTQKPSPAF